ncbi:MAG: GEVED domain-containing protein [Bacteroidales bacterium]
MKWALFFLLLFPANGVFSQNWLKNLPDNKSKQELTFFDYKNAFYKYWDAYKVNKGYYFENGIKKKAVGWKQFKRWEYNMENQVNTKTGEFPKKTAEFVSQEYLNSFPLSNTSDLGNWISLGTNSSTGGYAGIGRINCIAFHPVDTNIYWVGAASGGLWLTTDNGNSWNCLTDTLGVLAVSDIVIPSDFTISHTIYIATGDKDHWDNHSIGVLKSTNAGLSWNSTGLSFSLSNGKMVNSLLIDSSNNQTLIAATSYGVYKTTNGGINWSNQLSTTAFIDIEYKPGNFNTLYASTENGKIYVSSDSGITWVQAFSDINANRIEIAVSANQPNWVYALATASNSGLYAIYKSTDSGLSYSMVFDGAISNLLGWSADGGDTGGQGWYDLCMAVSPSNANDIFIGGINTWHSVNGGNSWTLANHWVGTNAQAVHADKHMLKFRNNGDLFECNDGGIYISKNNGDSWTDKTNGMQISQMYKLGISQTQANDIITGLQDNGSKLLSAGNWRDVKGGDGMECLIDYTNVNVQYASYVYGQITRTTDHWVNDYTDIEPAAAGEGSWVTPYIIDPVNNQTLYAAYADVWKTIDRGNSWTQISFINSSQKIRSMAIAPSNTQVIYVADPYTIWKTTNGGGLWSDITGTLPINSSYITNITVKNDDANTLWITMSAYNANKVFQSVNGGNTWINISAGLPQLPVYTIVQNKQSINEIQLYVGTELGVYFKKGSNNWVAFNSGLPNVKIGEIEIFYDSIPQNSKLRAATYGRGLWETTVYYNSLPMTYQSSISTQINTSNIAPGQINQEIIGVEIQTSGSLSPLNVSSFTFNTNGTTNPVSDINVAKLFISSTNVFDTTFQFGTAIFSPNGNFTFTGNHNLSDGANYFWLTYDVSSTATLANVLDAEFTTVMLGSASITPTIISPSGNRQIAIIYCNASSNICDEFISNVSFGSINNTTICSSGGYVDYSAISTDILKGTSLGITVTNGMPYTLDQCGIWVDWNNNGDFLDDSTISINGTPGGGPYSAIITPPQNTSVGLKKMRVRIHFNEEASSPCGIANYGEVEDYSINLLPPCLPPTVQTSLLVNQAISSHSMSIAFTRGNGDAVLVLAKEGSAVDADPVNGIAYNADTAFGNGSQIGSGNFVIYNGNANSINISALASGTNYFYSVYEYFTASRCYLQPALTASYTTYCDAGALAMDFEYISNVSIDTLNQVSLKGIEGYQDFTSQIADLKIGVTASLIIDIANLYSTDQILVWVDWNQDGDFTDTSENVFATTGNINNSQITANITPPIGSECGITRMRIRLHDTNYGPNSTPCGNADYGEVEDYSIRLSYLNSIFTQAVSNEWENAANWDNLVPESFVKAIIPSNKLAVINSNSNECKTLTIAALGKLTINSGKDLTISDTLYLESDASGTASLINYGSLSTTANIVQHYIPVSTTDEFHQLASPVINQSIGAGFSPVNESFYGWNETNGSWLPFEDTGFSILNGNYNFVPCRGYAVSYPSTTTKYFTGNLNNVLVNSFLSFTAGLYAGWNFIGNPYPSAINWNTSSGFNRNMLTDAGSGEKAYWVWNPLIGNYGCFISNAVSGTNGVSNLIASTQGFWVKAATAGTFNVNNLACEHSSQSWLKTAAIENNSIRLKVSTTENPYSDEVIINYGNQNDEKGAVKMFSLIQKAPDLYTSKFNKKWSINNLSSINNNPIIPLGFKAGVDGNYTISTVYDPSIGSLVIEDLKTGVFQNLSTNTNYIFTAQHSDMENRFLLHLSLSGVKELTAETPYIFYNNQTIKVFNPWIGKTTLIIYDIKGRFVQSYEMNKGNNNFAFTASQGVYVIKLINENQVFVKKEVVY